MFRRKRSDAPPALNRALRGTLAGLWGERLARAFWPFSSLLLLAAAALGFGAQDYLPPLWANVAAISLLCALLGTLVFGA